MTVPVLIPRWRILSPSQAYGLTSVVLALVVVVQIAAFGANDRVSSLVAALVNLIVAISLLIGVEGRSRFWMRTRRPVIAFSLALIWASLPALVPAGYHEALGIPPRPAPDLFRPELDKAIGAIALMLAAAGVAYRRRSIDAVLRWLTFLLALYGAMLLATPSLWAAVRGDASVRYAASIGNWNAAGLVFGILAILATGWPYREGRRGALHWLAVAVMVLGLFLCALTRSRYALTLTMLAMTILLVRFGARLRQPSRMSLSVTLGAVVVVVLAIGASRFPERYGALASDSISRFTVLGRAFRQAMDAPWWGYGLGNYFEVNQQDLTTRTAPQFWSFGAAHNAPLQWAMEAGWPSLACGLAGVLLIVFRIARSKVMTEQAPATALVAVATVAGAAMIDIAGNVPALISLAGVLLGSVWGLAAASTRHGPVEPGKT